MQPTPQEQPPYGQPQYPPSGAPPPQGYPPQYTPSGVPPQYPPSVPYQQPYGAPPPQQMQMSIGEQPHWLVPAAALALVIATFLPWYSFTYDGIKGIGAYSASVDAWQYWAGSMVGIVGFITLIYSALRYFKVQLPAIPLSDKLIYLVLSAAAVLFGLIYLTIGSSYGSAASIYNVSGIHIGPSFGLYIGVVAALAIVAGAYLSGTPGFANLTARTAMPPQGFPPQGFPPQGMPPQYSQPYQPQPPQYPGQTPQYPPQQPPQYPQQ